MSNVSREESLSNELFKVNEEKAALERRLAEKEVAMYEILQRIYPYMANELDYFRAEKQEGG